MAVLVESIWALRGGGGARFNVTHCAFSVHKRQTVSLSILNGKRPAE